MDRPTILEEGSHKTLGAPLTAHRSTLPNSLYVFSFAPPIPPISQPKEFFDHPIILYVIGTIAALIAGVALPAFDIITGVWTNDITAAGATDSQIIAGGSKAGWIMAVVGFVFFGLFGLFLYCFTVAATRMSNILREHYLSAIVVQDQAFFDRIGPGEIVTRASKDIDSVRTGLGERLGYLIWTLSNIIAAFVSAFVHAPKLAGVLFAVIPFTMVLFAGLGYWADNVSNVKSPMDGKTSSFIEQVLSSVRIVQSFDMAPKLLRKLETGMLAPLRKLSTKTSATRALEQAAAYGAGFLVYSLAYWYGGISVQNGLSVGNFLTTFFNFVNLFFSFASVVPHYIATTTAIQNLYGLRLQIERQPPIDIRDQSGLRLDDNKRDWQPSFELDNVTFAYPARPAHKALNRVSVHIEPAKFTAFVGPSGSGKSTLAALLMRMYDPLTATKISETDQKIMKVLEEGVKKEKKKGIQKVADEEKDKDFDQAIDGNGIVRFAGQDVTSLNLSWLRHQVAVVQQNPQLVSGTVFDNVAIGLTGTEFEYHADIEGASDASPENKARLAKITTLITDALRKAQAWDFVEGLPQGLQTEVAGGRTGVLSGGQVQRVALARALVREPRCLLLDEATSAVSADTELKIQESLLEEQKRRGMTLIVIAHRLSTIVSADKIVVMTNGSIAHSGTYEELLDPNCPDQTFRNMALAIPQTTPVSRATSVVTLDHSSEDRVLTMDEKAMAAAVDTGDIPPPMTDVKQAFKKVGWLLTIGIALGLAVGAAFVMAAWLHGRGVAALDISDLSEMRRQVNRWALWFLVLAIVAVILDTMHVFGLEASGESLVSQFRFEAVRHLVRQDIAYFEQKDTGFGNLTAQATSHPTAVGNVIGVVLAQVVSSTSNLVATLIMAFVLNWRMAVIVIPSLFVTVLLGYINFRLLTIFEDNLSAERDKQANFVAESANSIQLNAALTREAEVVREFKLKYTSRPMKRGVLFNSALALGGSQAMVQLFAALIFYWGALNLAQGRVALADLYTVIESVVVAIFIGAKILTYSGDFTRLYISLKAIQGWMDREPEIDTLVNVTDGSAAEPTLEKNSDGITLHNVELRYPSRPGVLSLAGVSIHMERGKSYAFCGTSGAGKSSILAVLQRFYNITSGSVTLDGKDIRSVDVKEYRSLMGYVSQEPVLFEETIRWNLLAGAINPESITQADLEHACEQARILDFIRSLPQGFETDIGLKGGQLSGGQRQRICIARALLRKPSILLLDEATSALDGESEAHVQQALDNASKGRLTITVGHRLSSIKGADVIFVMDQGQVVDQGTHEELLARQGKYFELVQAQL